MKQSFSAKKNPDIIAELVFAQTYNLKKLKQASIELAQSLILQELKKQKDYDKISSDNLQEIMEGMWNKWRTLSDFWSITTLIFLFRGLQREILRKRPKNNNKAWLKFYEVILSI